MAGLGLGLLLTLWPTKIGLHDRSLPPPERRRSSPVLVRKAKPSSADQLAWAYAGSLLQLAMRLEGEPPPSRRPDAGEAPICGLVLEVCADTSPLAHAARRRLICDIGPSSGGERLVHPGLSSLVIRHLVLRALVLERPGGDVRVEVADQAGSLAVRVVSRAGPRRPVGRSMEGESELCALQRLVRDMDAALLVEPVRGDRLALSVVLGPSSGAYPAVLASQAA